MFPIWYKKISMWIHNYNRGRDEHKLEDSTARECLTLLREGSREEFSKIWYPNSVSQCSDQFSCLLIFSLMHFPQSKKRNYKVAKGNTPSILFLNLSMNKYVTQSAGMNFNEIIGLLLWLTQNALCCLHNLLYIS